jgi:hypothetical protein
MTAKLEVLQDDEIPELPPEEMKVQVQKESLTYPMKAKKLAMAIVDAATYTAAANFLLEVKGFEKRVRLYFDGDIKKANELHKSLTSKRQMALEPLKHAEVIAKDAMSTYLTQQQRKQKEDEERARAEQRREDDAAKQSLAEAVHNGGEIEIANAILEQPATPIVLPKANEAPKITGIRTTEDWYGQVYDLRALVQDIAAGKAPLALIQADEKEIKRMAGALKGEMKYAGIRVWSQTGIAATGKVA